MSSNRGVKTQRKKGTVSDYNGARMNTAGVPVMQPVQPPQMMPNGAAAAMQQPLQYVLPSVDAPANHNTYRNMPNRNLSNPTMQFAPGEVNIDQTSSSSYTIQSRFSQPQTSSSYPAVSQVSAFPGPPNYNPSVFNSTGYSQSFCPISNTQYYSVVTPPFCQAPVYYQTTAQPPTAFMQQRMVYQQPVAVPTTSVPQAPPRQKKILQIVDPLTHEVTNPAETVDYSLTEQPEGGRRSAALLDSSSRDAIPQQSNASQNLLRQVANTVFNTSSSPPASVQPPGVVEEPISDNPLQPPRLVKQLELPTSNVEALEVTSVRIVPDIVKEEETKVGEFISSIDTSSSGVNKMDLSVEMAGVSNINTEESENVKDVFEDESKKEGLDSPLETLTEPEAELKPAPGENVEIGVELDQPDHGLAALTSEVSAVAIREETKRSSEDEEVSQQFEEKESEEIMKERKRKELEAERQEILNEPESTVDVANKVYGRKYMYLMRKWIKEFSLTASCPVDIGELKNLGIDIASAPSSAPTGYGAGRRFDFSTKSSGSFTPAWVDNKQKKTPYYGRASDRSGHGGRGDRERKKSSVARLATIERPTREPVKLHKAENAWRPEIVKKDAEDENKKLYKQIRGLLNKITPSTFESLCEEFLRYKCYENKENMNEIINIIFDKAVEEPKFCPLYSDLCKNQVAEELKQGNVSEFRNRILTRCQQTFENKRQTEIDKKKKEAEEEQDEKKKKELKLEAMEMEAKERRRMFGNINFIGQLYRRELIVPKILKWCIIHLLKNHSEAPNGDDESIECAVRMLETVGKLVDSHQLSGEFDFGVYFSHLKELSQNVSSRIRFLILNLIELRENKWNPRKTADAGPMTIAAVHDEARKEEMQAKIAREQYDKTRKPYDGRASLDRRRPPVLVGRQSQDNRFFSKGDQSRDQRSRAAGQAAHNAGTSSRKNQTLSTVDVQGKLGYRKGAFNAGSSGGSGQDGRKSGVSSLRGAGRGMVASRDNSEPSSREPSESRKHSVAGDRMEREKALAAVQTVTRSNIPSSASASCLTTNLEGSRSGSHSGEEDRGRANVLSEEAEKKLLSTFSVDLHEYFEDPKSEDRVNELRTSLKEIIAKSSISTAFRLLMRVGVEKINAKKDVHRQYLGRALCLCLQDVERKDEALRGISDFCNYAVEYELWQDEAPLLWDWVAEIISWSIMCDTKDVEGERPSLQDFKNAFLAAEGDSREKHTLLVNTLSRLAEIEQGREGNTSSTAMAFEELKGLDSPSLREALKRKRFSSGGSLHDKLLS